MIIRSKHLQTLLRHLGVEKKLVDFQITARDWYELEKIQKLLAKFDRATKLISMARHPKISAYLPTLDWLLEYLREYVAENSGCVANAVQKAVIKLEKYELAIEVSVIPFVGIFLNPALKLNYFREEDKYSNLAVRQIQKSISEYFEKEYVNDKPARKSDTEDDADDDLYSFMFLKEPKSKKIQKKSTNT